MRQISSKGIILEHKILLSVRWTRTIFMKEEPTACEWTVAGLRKEEMVWLLVESENALHGSIVS